MLTSHSHLRLPQRSLVSGLVPLPVDPLHVSDADAEPDLPSHKSGMHLGQDDIGKGRPEFLLIKMQVPEVGYFVVNIDNLLC